MKVFKINNTNLNSSAEAQWILKVKVAIQIKLKLPLLIFIVQKERNMAYEQGGGTVMGSPNFSP